MRLPRGLRPLRNRNYALYWVGFATSNAGKWVEQTGTVWLVYELTRSPVLLGLLGIARAVPMVLLSPFAGVMADRVDQRRFLIAAQSVSLVASLTLGILVATGRVELWHIYLQVAIVSAVTAFDWAIRHAMFPRLAPRDQLLEVVTLQSTAARTTGLVGPAIGGLLIAQFGTAAPFFVNAASFLVLMAGLALIRDFGPRVVRAASSIREDLVEGIRHLGRVPVLSGLLKLELVYAIFQANPAIITIVGVELLGAGPDEVGLMLAAPAAGAVVGIAMLLAFGATRRQGRLVVLSTLAYSATLVAFATSTVFAVTLAILAVNGLFDAMLSVTRNNIVQLAAPGQMRGRLMANMATVTRGLSPAAQTQSGALVGALGPRVALGVAAVVLAAATLATVRTSPGFWSFAREDFADSPEPEAASA